MSRLAFLPNIPRGRTLSFLHISVPLSSSRFCEMLQVIIFKSHTNLIAVPI